jgi:glycosyltransferase involved in cell wall biosynthesis
MMKISLITVTYNADKFLAECLASVKSQMGIEIEYIVIDGLSSDNTVNIIQQYNNVISHFVSEKDGGIYDAMNKGIQMATGDIIGILNADDALANNTVLFDIQKEFKRSGADIVYGDLDYVDSTNTNIVLRKWKSRPYNPGIFQWGWMPAHPTFYARKELFEKYGNYRLDMGSAADYELMIRFMHKHQVKATYLPGVMVKMRIGGASNGSMGSRLKANLADMKAMKLNGIKHPRLTALLKPLRKLPQFFSYSFVSTKLLRLVPDFI